MTSGFTSNMQSMVRKQQDSIIPDLTAFIPHPGSSINSEVWSKKDYMLVEENDLHYCKISNENYTYSNKLKKARINMVNTSGFVEVASLHS